MSLGFYFSLNNLLHGGEDLDLLLDNAVVYLWNSCAWWLGNVGH